MSESVPRVLLVCSGLDHARRGFESFARECFEVLRPDDGVRIELVKGSGSPAPGERAVPTPRRDRRLARAIGAALRVPSFRVESFAFALSLQPVIARRRPDVVYLSEWDTARVLAALRAATAGRFKLALCNGTLAAEGFDHLDLVQDLTPAARQYVLDRGADPERHKVLPLGFRIGSTFSPATADERRALRQRLRLPVERQIVISVAALNRHHKRLDYVIEEIERIREPRPFLLLVGEPDAETAGLRRLGRDRLGDGHSIRTVPAAEVVDHYRASDIFVLASFYEGLPRALIEALAQGLPCLAHAYPIPEFALGAHGYLADLREAGALAALICGLDEDAFAPPAAAERHRYAYENFSWERLKPRYVALLREAADGKLSRA